MSTQCPLNGRPNQSVRKLMESLLERSEQEHKFSLLQKNEGPGYFVRGGQRRFAHLKIRPSMMLAPWTKYGLQNSRPLLLPNPTLTPRPLQLCPLHSEVSLVQRCGQHCPLHVMNHQFSVSASLQPTRQTSCCLWDATNCREP